MKTIKAILIVTGLVSLSSVGCAPQPASIEPTPTKLMLTSTEDPTTLSVRVLDAQGQEIPKAQLTFTSTAPEVAAVDATGTITAKSSGQSVVSIAAGQVSAEVPVEVALYSAIKLEPTTLALTVGDAKTVAAQVDNEKGEPTKATVNWQTSDAAIATVSAAGEVTAMSAGTATITAAAATLQVSLDVTVALAGPASLKAGKDAVELKKGKSEKVEIEVLDAAGTAMQGVSLTWTSSDEKVATVSPEGEIMAVAKGEATVTVTDGVQSAAINVVVKK